MLPFPLLNTFSHYEIELLKSLSFYLDLGSEQTFNSEEIKVEYSYRPSSESSGSSTTQFIHLSGTLLVSILSSSSGAQGQGRGEGGGEGGGGGGSTGFECQPNRIFLSHSKGEREAKCQEVLENLKCLAGDEVRLRELWKMGKKREM